MEQELAIGEITPAELKEKLDAGEEILLLDVREDHELEICNLENTTHIPLGHLVTRLGELNDYKEKPVVVYCRSGKRSARAAYFMVDEGFKNVSNLVGGILRWADEVDPSLTKY